MPSTIMTDDQQKTILSLIDLVSDKCNDDTASPLAHGWSGLLHRHLEVSDSDKRTSSTSGGEKVSPETQKGILHSKNSEALQLSAPGMVMVDSLNKFKEGLDAFLEENNITGYGF
ncbi:uncharacterized protein RB166_002791 [Leptodactylus fuscus]